MSAFKTGYAIFLAAITGILLPQAPAQALLAEARGAARSGGGAGARTCEGGARIRDAGVGARRADQTGDEGREGAVGSAAGRTEAQLTGTAPRAVDLGGSAGRLALELPDEVYAVRSEVSAGSLDNRLQTSDAAPRIISAEVSAGSAELASARR